MADKNTDLAVLKVNASGKLPALALGRADDVEVGEDVIAVGHPYGYSFTVLAASSAPWIARSNCPPARCSRGLIQTDAAINPGNSGGPLLNINGEFIGINAALRDGAQGIAFAINTDTIKGVLSDKLSALKVAGVSHGLQVQDKAIAGTGSAQGVIVAGLNEASAAAGLKKGDVIRGVGPLSIGNSFDLERCLWDAKPGQRIAVRVARQGQELSVTITLSASGSDLRDSLPFSTLIRQPAPNDLRHHETVLRSKPPPRGSCKPGGLVPFALFVPFDPAKAESAAMAFVCPVYVALLTCGVVPVETKFVQVAPSLPVIQSGNIARSPGRTRAVTSSKAGVAPPGSQKGCAASRIAALAAAGKRVRQGNQSRRGCLRFQLRPHAPSTISPMCPQWATMSVGGFARPGIPKSSC